MKALCQFMLININSFFIFLIVGAITALINFAIFYFGYSIFHLHYQMAVSLAFILGVIFQFNANRFFTFKSSAISFYQQIPKYLGLLLLSYAITLFVMRLVVEMGHFSPYLGYIAAIFATVMINYLLSRYWVFARKNPQGE